MNENMNESAPLSCNKTWANDTKLTIADYNDKVYNFPMYYKNRKVKYLEELNDVRTYLCIGIWLLITYIWSLCIFLDDLAKFDWVDIFLFHLNIILALVCCLIINTCNIFCQTLALSTIVQIKTFWHIMIGLSIDKYNNLTQIERYIFNLQFNQILYNQVPLEYFYFELNNKFLKILQRTEKQRTCKYYSYYFQILIAFVSIHLLFMTRWIIIIFYMCTVKISMNIWMILFFVVEFIIYCLAVVSMYSLFVNKFLFYLQFLHDIDILLINLKDDDTLKMDYSDKSYEYKYNPFKFLCNRLDKYFCSKEYNQDVLNCYVLWQMFVSTTSPIEIIQIIGLFLNDSTINMVDSCSKYNSIENVKKQKYSYVPKFEDSSSWSLCDYDS